MSTQPRRLPPWLDYLLLLAVVALLLHPYVLGQAPLPDYLRWFGAGADGRPVHTPWNALWYDALGQYWPWRTLLHNALRHGTLPLWDPYQFCGYSFVGNGQSAVFYPPNWILFGLLPVTWGFRLTAIGHLWLAAAGAYAVGRELGASRSAALLSGVCFGLSGFLVTWLPLPTLLCSAAWLPWAWAGVERARRTGDARWAAAGGAAVGLAALAGHAQIFYYVAVTTMVIASARLLPRQWPAWLLCGAVAGLLAAPGLLPVLELAPRSHRPPGKSAAGYEAFVSRAIPALRAVTLVAPRFYGSPERGTLNPAAPNPGGPVFDGAYWGLDRRGSIAPGDFTEFNVYVGLAPLLLLLLALARPGPGRLYGGLALVALVLAFGLPVNRLLYFLLPGYSAGAGPCRLALVWSCGVAVAAGLAVDSQERRVLAAGWVTRAALLGGMAVVATTFLTQAVLRGWGLGPLVGAASFRHLVALLVAVVLLAASAATLRQRPAWSAAVVAVDLLAFGWGFNPTCEPGLLAPRPVETRSTRSLVLDSPARWGFYAPPAGLALPPNLATVQGVRDVGGYDSLLPAAIKQALFEATGGRQPCPATNGNMLLLGDVEPRLAGHSVGTVIRDGQPLTVPGAPSRVLLWNGRTRPQQGPAAALTQDGLNRLTLTAEHLMPILLDGPDPGWRAYVGPVGSARLQPVVWSVAPLKGVDALNRFVPLDFSPAGGLAGPQRVQWVFQPTSVRVGEFLALLAAALLAALVGYGPATPARRG